MTTFTDINATLSPDEHDRELRRAIVAATVGTTIEWYDFLLYSTMAGLPSSVNSSSQTRTQ